MEEFRLEVPADQAGQRLDQVLASHLADRTRSQIQRLIKEGHAMVGTRQARASLIVQQGDIVVLRLPAPAPPSPQAEALPLTILYDDSDIVVVDKPAGMVVHPAAGHSEGTLVNALLHHVRDLSGIGGVLRPGIVHRLDRGTSGLMVVAKCDRAHAALAAQFAAREVNKEYIALTWGTVQAGRRINLPIGRDPTKRQRFSTSVEHGRAAMTHITQAMHYHGVTLVHVTIATGRTHQIRVHLSAIGHPVVGDPLYGGVRRHTAPRLRALQRLKRPFLHAARLTFRHPVDGREMTFDSPLPPDLSDVLLRIQRAAPDPDRKPS